MKKLLIAALCMALGVLVATSAFAFTGTFIPGGGINGTVHDLPGNKNGMSYGNAADTLNRICIFCHAPHNTIRLNPSLDAASAGGSNVAADAVFTYLPLWNHTLTSQYASYQLYNNGPGAPLSGSHASQAILNGMTPGSVSLLCLSCHDGSVAVNAYGNAAAQPSGSYTPAPAGTISGQYVIGQGNYLGNHHPIGFDYELAQSQDAELRPSSTVMSNYNSVQTTIADHLYAGTNMECGTCHSVHNKNNSGERLLWRSDVNSQLCLTCHDKGTYTDPVANPDTTGVALP